eukprot:PITA_12371
MLGYDFEIIYKKGKQNVVADALSRKDVDVEALLCAISIIQPNWINEARDEWKNDEEVWALIRKLQQDSSTSDTFSWKMIRYGTKIAYTSNVLVCQQNKVETIKTPGLLQPLSIPSQRWEEVSMDFITELFSCLGTQLAHSSSYHPQSDGKTEIVNKCLEGYLRCFVYDKQTQWVKWLPLAEWWYNTSFHTATKMTPFMALYGYQPPSITSYLRENSKVQAVEHHIEHQQQVLQLLKDNLMLAQNRMKQKVDQHRSERNFDVGD